MLNRLALALVPVAALLSLAAFGGTSGFTKHEARSVEPVTAVGPTHEVDAAIALANLDALYANVEAEMVAAYLDAMRPRIAVDWARWERLHVCEQSNTWYANGGNPADGARQVFQGGLGMSTGAWQMAVRAAAARGVALPGSALQASPEEQMTGAQAFYDAHGWGWACKV